MIEIQILGLVFLFFRMWLVEFKLKEKLRTGRTYLSRTVNYIYAFAVIFDFKNLGCNLVVFYGTPVFIAIFFIWDVKFPAYYRKRTDWHDTKFWIIVERLTMHPPMIALGIWFYTQGLFQFNEQALIYNGVTNSHDWYVIREIILSGFYSLGFYVLWDPRWYPLKKGWPLGLWILVFAIISVAIHATIFWVNAPVVYGY